MCTVTLVALGETNFILTSNRDEAPSRVSKSPGFYEHNDSQLLYPEDVESGGTWIGLSDRKRLICLLNGGFEVHKRKSVYRQSRGLVVKDLLSCSNLYKAVNDYDLYNIEPFTMVIVDWNSKLKCLELVWDGNQKHLQVLDKTPHIWSSSTLFEKNMRSERKQWFENFQTNHELDADALQMFHKTAGQGNLDYGVIMDRGFVKTTSITQVRKEDDAITMDYEDLESKNHYQTIFNDVEAL